MIESYFVGMRHAVRHWKLALLLYGANLFLALPIAIPLFVAVGVTTSRTTAAGAMLADRLDPAWAVDFFNHRFPGFSAESLATQMGGLLLLFGIAALALNTFFAGGVLEALRSPEEAPSMARFWSGCGAHFWRFVRLLPLSLLAYGVGAFLVRRLGARLNRGDDAAFAYGPLFYKHLALDALLALVLAFLNMVFDYARIGAVIHYRRGMFREMLRAFAFAGRRAVSAFALYGGVVVTGLALFAAFAWLRSRVPQASGGRIALAFLLGQFALGARAWSRLHLFAAQRHFFHRHAPRPEPDFEFARAAEPFEFAAATEPASAADRPSPFPTPEPESL